VTHDRSSRRVKRVETFSIAPSEEAFGAIAAAPAGYCEDNEEQFAGFLKRALEHDAPLSNPSDHACMLAAHARMALTRIEDHDLPALDQGRVPQLAGPAVVCDFFPSSSLRLYEVLIVSRIVSGRSPGAAPRVHPSGSVRVWSRCDQACGSRHCISTKHYAQQL
jgi:hypothetical protein